MANISFNTFRDKILAKISEYTVCLSSYWLAIEFVSVEPFANVYHNIEHQAI